jgi:hypothetical protein
LPQSHSPIVGPQGPVSDGGQNSPFLHSLPISRAASSATTALFSRSPFSQIDFIFPPNCSVPPGLAPCPQTLLVRSRGWN